MKSSSVACAAFFAAVVVTSPADAGLPPTTPVIVQPKCYTYTNTNAAAGDIVLTASSGLIRALVNSIGQKYTHVGMTFVRGASDFQAAVGVRHNSMNTGDVDPVGGLIPDHLNTSGKKSLRDGGPGVADSEWDDRGFNIGQTIVLTGPSAYASKRRSASSAMAQLDGYYRLYAYTDMTWKNPTVRSMNDGNMCSGTVATALMRASLLDARVRVTYTAATRMTAAEATYNEMRKSIIGKVDGWQERLFNVGTAFGQDSLKEFATNVANQVVNCMAFNDCGNTTARWRQGVGAGSTIAPDDLLTIASNIAAQATRSGITNTYPYQTTMPMRNVSTTTCCTNPPLVQSTQHVLPFQCVTK